jgi:hypothetical protein
MECVGRPAPTGFSNIRLVDLAACAANWLGADALSDELRFR